MLYKYGGQVRMERALDAIPQVGEFEHRFVSVDHAVNRVENPKLSFPPTTEEYGRNREAMGVGGAATLASAEKGAKIFEAIAANTARFVKTFQNIPVTIKATAPPL